MTYLQLPSQIKNKVFDRPPVPGSIYLEEALHVLNMSKTFFYREIRRELLPKPQTWIKKSFWMIEDLDAYVVTKLQKKGA